MNKRVENGQMAFTAGQQRALMLVKVCGRDAKSDLIGHFLQPIRGRD